MAVIDQGRRSLARLLRAAQAAEPDALVDIIASAVGAVGGHDVVLYLVDYEQTVLMPHPDLLARGEQPEVATIDGSMAGRAFQTLTSVATERGDGWRVWVPVYERASKLGVLALSVPRWDEEVAEFCTELGMAVAYLVMASAEYTDQPHLLRRRKNMDLAAEMQWSLLPPLSFAAGQTSLAGLVEPAYEVGGDCFDYALNGGTLDLAIFDAMGHGLNSAVRASLLIGAYRHARRAGDDLASIARAVDAATQRVSSESTFATSLFARLNKATGHLVWMTCGHPQPIVVRRATTLPDVEVKPGVPCGLGMLGEVVGDLVEMSLEPGDGVLFYTDGVVEARDQQGRHFGEDRLRDLLGREHLAGGQPQEIIRRLVRSALSHSGDRLRDDATLLYLRWNDSADPQ